MRVVRRLALLLLVLAVLSVGSAGARGTAGLPVAAATAWAITISVPGQGDVTSATVTAPPPSSPAGGGPFSYPADGSIVSVQSTTATASTAVTTNAAAKAEADATGISLFGGEITLAAVTAAASAGTGRADAGGNFVGSQAVGLTIDGHPTSGQRVALADWGTLTFGAQVTDSSGPTGTAAYRGDVTELDLRLAADHDGLPAGSEIRIGFAEAAAQTAPPTTPATTTSPSIERTPTRPATTPRRATRPATPAAEPPVGDRPQLLPHSSPASRPAGPLRRHPRLTGALYVFPVYGASSYRDGFRARRAHATYLHGDDIYGQLGQPLVACASGTLFSVGWTKDGGNRLWIRDAAGNEFSYAHLSAFSTLTADGAHVKAGEVVGFMGNTGDAEGTPVHLQFEVHPVSLLYLGADGAVDPTRYLAAWRHVTDIPLAVGAGWAPPVPGGASAPEPGAMLLGMSDISSADGLDPASLRQALLPSRELLQTLVPTPLPRGDIGTATAGG
jgi:murein DD-endopeptidase MepM/ murein hydrolase activator NlpD